MHGLTHRSTHRFRTIVLVLAALLGCTVWAAPTGSATAAGTATYKVWHWNVAGDQNNYGSTSNGLVDAILGSVSYRNPDFVSLNEICPDQYKAVLKGLQDAGWPQSSTNFARFEPMPDTTGFVCKNSNGTAQGTYGVALFSRFAPTGTDRITLPSDGDRERKLLCVSLGSQPGGLRFCTTHITFDSAAKPAQLDAVRQKAEEWTAAGGTVITAGDFNTQPHDPLLNSWYTPSVATVNNGGNTGLFHELDDQDTLCPGWGEQTTEGALAGKCGQPGKVDLIWAAAGRLVSYDEDAHPIATDRCVDRTQQYIPCSDHRIVDATLTVTTP